LTYLVNPIYGIFGWEKIALLDEAYKFGSKYWRLFSTRSVKEHRSFGVLLIPWFAKLLGRKNALIVPLYCRDDFYGIFLFLQT